MTEELAGTDIDDISPLHGYQGERDRLTGPLIPPAPSVAISREVGARGGEVARRLAAKTGWPLYDAELLGYSAQDVSAIDSLLAELPAEAGRWIEERMTSLQKLGMLSTDPTFERLSRLILALAAKGEAIFVGRGAGFILPRQTTLHVRMIAPLADRISYMSQWLRLSRGEAEAQVAAREAKRAEFLGQCLHLSEDGIIYDMILNSSALGEELCIELIVQALPCKKPRKPADSSDSFVV
jgi:cytidylate kinase